MTTAKPRGRGEELKQLTVKDVIRLNGIIGRTKKRRIKFKLIGRISDGTFDCFCRWLQDKHAHRTIDKTPGGFRMPNRVEMVKRYGKEAPNEPG